MRKAEVWINKKLAGILEELEGARYHFQYLDSYQGAPVSLTMPVRKKVYEYDRFPPFFEGLLPEGMMLHGLLMRCKLDKTDYFGQLLEVGNDVVGAVTVRAIP